MFWSKKCPGYGCDRKLRRGETLCPGCGSTVKVGLFTVTLIAGPVVVYKYRKPITTAVVKNRKALWKGAKGLFKRFF